MSRTSAASILGVEVDALTAPELLVELRQRLEAGKRTHVVTVNNEIIMRARRDPTYRKLINNADFRVADSAGVVWASAYLARKERGPLAGLRHYTQALWLLILLLVWPRRVQTVIPGTIPGSDLATDVAAMCEEFGFRLYLLGAGPGVAEQAGAELLKEFPELKVVGDATDPDAKHDATVRKRITAVKAEVVLVAYGAPKQEQWIARNLPKLSKPKLAIGVGGTLDYLAGAASVQGGSTAKPPPEIMRQRGLEWLWRLFTQPSRWRRIFTAFPLFVRAVIQEKRRQVQ